MFNNIGKKIKNLAKTICTLVFAFFLLYALFLAATLFSQEEILQGLLLFLLYAAIGFLISWISSIFVYGFGELIENSSKSVSIQKECLEIQKNILKNVKSEKNKTDNEWTRPSSCEQVENEAVQKEGFKVIIE
jgi:predicted PurR-regulated permease PerM